MNQLVQSRTIKTVFVFFFVGILFLSLSFFMPGQAFAGTWKHDAVGWQYDNGHGNVSKAKWQKIGGVWYYFDNKGYMHTGFLKDAGKTYYLKSTGAMATGWIKDAGNWYYASKSGAMTTGWVQSGKKWYYLDSASFIMQVGWIKDKGKWYYLNNSGAMLTGWFKAGGKWYYANGSGAMQASKWISNKYYLGSDGAMLVNTWTPDGYWVDKNGLYTRSGQVEAVLNESAAYANSFDNTADKLNVVAQVVYYFVTQSSYGSNSSGTYAKPYGLIIDHKYTCAATAAMSADILSRMGYSNVKHVNKNQNKHQWAEVKIGGVWWIVEGQMGFATKKSDAPNYPNGAVTLPDGTQIYTYGSI